MANLFTTLSSSRICEIVRLAKRSICYAGPGIHLEVARTLVPKADELGADSILVNLDVDENTARMGYGKFDAVKVLRESKINVCHVPGLRLAFVICDDFGYLFTPTAEYLEPEPSKEGIPNAMRLTRDQVGEMMARFSPVANAMAIGNAKTEEERERIRDLNGELSSVPVTDEFESEVEQKLDLAPPVKFDLARQVRVYSAYLQYVEINLTGVAIQRKRLAIPNELLELASGKDLEGRLRTTYELINKENDLSSHKLEFKLNQIRSSLTRSLGKQHGRVVLKSVKKILDEDLDEFKSDLEEHQKDVREKLDSSLKESMAQIVDYYVPLVLQNKPRRFVGSVVNQNKESARRWLEELLGRNFPEPDDLTKKMRLDVQYKDVTYATLNDEKFIESVKTAFPSIDWQSIHEEFLAAGENADKMEGPGHD